MLPTRERKTYTYNNPIEWASRAPLVRNPLSPLRSSLVLTAPSLLFSLSLGITHWCYNPLVLRRRTCCPVSNTLFFFIRFHLPPGTHMHTSLPYDRSVIDERRLPKVRSFVGPGGRWLVWIFDCSFLRLEQVFPHFRVSTMMCIVLHRCDNAPCKIPRSLLPLSSKQPEPTYSYVKHLM